MGVLRLAIIILGLAVVTVVLLPVQIVAIWLKWRLAAWLPHYWQRSARRLMGMRVRVVGTPAEPPLLIAANHVSWMDITVLGSILPVSFVAKAEVAGWPVVGLLARLQRTVFVDRTRRSQAVSAGRAVAGRIDDGDIMVLFAEGTTGDGNGVLPFKSALLGAVAGEKPITVQPVAVTYVGISGTPVGRPDRPHIAWYGDMAFAPHFARLQDLGMVDAVVSFGEPIAFGPDSDRKALAEACYRQVRRMAASAGRGALSPNGQFARLFSPRPKNATSSV